MTGAIAEPGSSDCPSGLLAQLPWSPSAREVFLSYRRARIAELADEIMIDFEHEILKAVRCSRIFVPERRPQERRELTRRVLEDVQDYIRDALSGGHVPDVTLICFGVLHRRRLL